MCSFMQGIPAQSVHPYSMQIACELLTQLFLE